MLIRLAERPDIPSVAAMLNRYMEGLAKRTWQVDASRIEQDMFDRHLVTIAVAERTDLVGFAAWVPTYDIHHPVAGGDLIDLYVEPHARGVGIAAALIAFVCAEVQKAGGVYIRGGAVPDAVALYSRVAWGWDCREMILGGRAFRTIAACAGQSPKDIIRSLPDPAWNHEP